MLTINTGMISTLHILQHKILILVCIFSRPICVALQVSATLLIPTVSPSIGYNTESQDWDVIRTSLIVYVPLFIGMFLLFCYVRTKFPMVYNVRNTVATLKNPIAAMPHGYFSWIWKTFRIEESEIFRTCGMDALCLLKITRMGSCLSLVSVFCSIFLIPVYENEDTFDNYDGFVSRTTTSLPYGSSSFTATVVGAYIIFGSTMVLIFNDFRWFIHQRETFLSTTEARNYTIYVSGIPPQYRSDAGLAQFFRRVIADDVVHSAFVAMYIPKLTAAVDRQTTLVNTLERMKAIRDMNNGKEPMQFVLGPKTGEILDRVPAIPYYTEQLDTVRNEVEELQQIIAIRQQLTNAERPKSTSAIPSGEEKNNFREKSSKGIFVSAESIASGVYVDVTDVDSIAEQLMSIRALKEVLNEDTTIKESDKDIPENTIHFSDESIQADSERSRNDVDGNDQTLLSEAKEAAARMMEKNRNEVPILRLLDAGFVTFRKLSAVAVALQTVQSTIPFQMDVFEAPSPDQIIWKNVGLSNRMLQPRRLIAVSLTILLCLFWTVPVTLLVSLTEINVLKEKFPFLEEWLVAAPWLEALLNQISPLLLSFLNSVVVPVLLRLLSAVEGVIGLSQQEASLFLKLAAFQLVQTFLVASLAGGVTSALAEVDQVSDIFRYLAKTLPPQSVYFMQLVLIQTVIGLGSEMLRTTALVQALLRSQIGPRVTKTDRYQVFLGLRPLSNPRYFLHAQVLAGTSLRFMVLFTFSVLSPFVGYFLLFAFIAMEIGYRHQFIYVYPPILDSGGQLWMKFITITLVCMIAAEIVLITFMTLSKATAQAYAIIPLLLSSILFMFYLRQRHFKVANYLSLETCDKIDNFNKFNQRSAEDVDFLNNKFKQPELLAVNNSNK